jgi:hypothetical protein
MLPTSSEKFRLDLVEQTWLGNEPPQFDLCSHGRFWLEVNGQVILDGREIYGISESALALLRTLDHDHTPQQSMAEKLIFHGCGTVLMMGCPIGVNWSVFHQEDQVLLKDFKRWDSSDEQRPSEFPDLEVVLSFKEYQRQVLALCTQVREFFKRESKEFFDTQDQINYERFWSEFEMRYKLHAMGSG